MSVIPRSISKNFKKPIKLYWWRDPALGANGNFGDEITRVIIENLFYRKVVWSSKEECEIIGAGSILEHLSDINNHPVIWGSGFIERGNLKLDFGKYDVRALRGKSTLDRLVNLNSAHNVRLGDPGLLAKLIIERPANHKEYRLGIVPHYVDYGDVLVSRLSKMKFTKIINPLDGVINVMNEISKCDYVLSSSLHGLILSDSFGIPNSRIHFTDKIWGGDYKYTDYFSVFKNKSSKLIDIDYNNIQLAKIIGTIEENYRDEPETIDRINSELIDSFPY